MTTTAPPLLTALAVEWDSGMDFASAVLSGIVGDLEHKERGGFHISIEDNPAGNFSIVRVDDKAPPGTWPRNQAAAIDMSMSTADMRKCHNRLKAAFFDRSDPRRVYINAFNGWDGVGSAGRYDMVAYTVSVASKDHEWHEHLELRRRYTNNPYAIRAVRSILIGQSKEEWEREGGDNDVIMLVKLGTTSEVWCTDLQTRWLVKSPKTLGGVQAMVVAQKVGDGVVRTVDDLDAFGIPVESLLTASATREAASAVREQQLAAQAVALTATVKALADEFGQSGDAILETIERRVDAALAAAGAALVATTPK